MKTAINGLPLAIVRYQVLKRRGANRILIKIVNKMINILPLNDYEEHEESTTCKCLPKVEFNDNGEMLVIHNSFDGREATEGFNTVKNIFKPKN